MQRTDRHTRTVGWLKIAMPLAALALLSTLFLLSDRIDPEQAIPYAQVDVESLVRDPRMTAPTFAGTTADGSAITVVAASARAEAENRPAEAQEVLATIENPGGSTTEVSALEARLVAEGRSLDMKGDVRITTSSGWVMTTTEMTAHLDRSGAESRGPVQAEGPPGRIEAGGFTLTNRPDDNGESHYLLVFSGGVKLLYQPGG